MNGRCLTGVLLLALLAAPAAAQDADIRAQLTGRGLSNDLAVQVAAIAAEASARGVPTGPLVDKAIEGYSKHVAEARIIGAVRLLSGRLADAREAVRAAGLNAPTAEVVAAAAEAMGRGIAQGQIGAVVRAAPAPAVAPGLSVAAALVAEGLGSEQAVAVVVDAMRAGRPVSQILDLPSAARAMESQGMSPADIGREMLHGGEGRHDGGHRDGGMGGQTPDLPPPPGMRPPRGGHRGPGRP